MSIERKPRMIMSSQGLTSSGKTYFALNGTVLDIGPKVAARARAAGGGGAALKRVYTFSIENSTGLYDESLLEFVKDVQSDMERELGCGPDTPARKPFRRVVIRVEASR